MASLPAFSLARRTITSDAPTPATDADASRLVADVDAKLQLARRLREEDAARRTTSVAPPSRPIY